MQEGYAKHVQFGRDFFIMSPIAYITFDFKTLVAIFSCWFRFRRK